MADTNDQLTGPVAIDPKNISTKSAEFLKYYRSWQKCRDVFEGQDVIHDNGISYLPKLSLQDDAMYEAYKTRARFFNVFKRTLQGLLGLVKRKDAIVELGNIPDEIADDITLTGLSLQEYANNVLSEILVVGVCGTLVDHPVVNEELTIAERDNGNIRPNFVLYTTEQIINHEYFVLNGIKTLKLVVLEQQSLTEVDIFKKKIKKQYLVLLLEEVEPGHYYYRNVLFEEADKTFIVIHDTYPLLDGARITQIPFFFHGEYAYPPMYDLCTSNIMHYQLKADHNHCLHYIGLPTPVITGVDPKDESRPRTIGPEQIMYISDPGASAFYMELEGKGLGALTDELAKLEEDMAYLGASMLVSDAAVNETATKAAFRYATETSALQNITTNGSKTISGALKFFATWNDNDPDVKFEFNDDFNPLGLSSQDILALVQSWQNGAFSKTTLFDKLQKGEVIDAERTFEEEQDLINQGQ